MHRLIQVLALFALLLAAVPASAGDRTVWRNGASTDSINYLEGVALNATASARTITLDLNFKWEKLTIFVFHTNSAATDVQATFSCSLDGTNFARRQSRAISSGTATLSDFTDSKDVSGDADFYLEHDVRACAKVQMVFSGTSAGGSDTINVQVAAVSG